MLLVKLDIFSGFSFWPIVWKSPILSSGSSLLWEWFEFSCYWGSSSLGFGFCLDWASELSFLSELRQFFGLASFSSDSSFGWSRRCFLLVSILCVGFGSFCGCKAWVLVVAACYPLRLKFTCSYLQSVSILYVFVVNSFKF